jgi:hypothetical protein
MKSSQAWVTVLLAVSGLQALAIAGLIAAAPKSTQTAAAPPASDKGKPVKVELNKETGQKRVTLTAKAAERLGIATADVRDEAVAPKTVALGTVQSVAEAPIIVTASVPGIVAMPTDASALRPGDRLSAKQPVLRLATLVDMAGKNPITTTAGIAPSNPPKQAALRPGEVASETTLLSVEAPCDCTLLRMLVQPGQAVQAGHPLFEAGDASGGLLIRVPLTADLSRVAKDQPGRILPLGSQGALAGATAKPAPAPAATETKDDDGPDADAQKPVDALWYQVQASAKGLTPKQPVRLELPVAYDGSLRKAIPYSAVFYDASGQTWTYVNPEPLVYTRQRITVDYVEGDMAVLTSGPAAGTRVVSVGAVLLYGAESQGK